MHTFALGLFKAQLRHAHFLGKNWHAFTLASHLVELAPRDLLGGVRRRRLEELASKTPRRFLDVLEGYAFASPLRTGWVAVAIVRRRSLTESDHALVGLVHSGEKALQPGRAPRAEQEKSRRERIERSAV